MRRMRKKKFEYIFMLALVGVYLVSQLPLDFYLWSVGVVLSLFLLRTIFKFLYKPTTYINSDGYVVLSQSNELEHRSIAKQVLGRDLMYNEVVHHINGRKTDNKIRNLCLMDREKHEHFHSWLSWKKSKSGRYPKFSDQKRILVKEYNGILLESIKTSQTRVTYVPTSRSEITESEMQKTLFDDLRKERKRLATERNIPVYIVFDNKTLTEMAKLMPETEAGMLQIIGVGPAKFQMYGSSFIAVIQKFKTSSNRDARRKKDPA